MIPIPYRDENPRLRFPLVTSTIIALNLAAWLFELARGVDLSVLDYGLIPSWLLRGTRDGPLSVPGMGRLFLHQEVPVPLTVLTSMFLHGSWLHIIGNMWFLWIFGDNVEDVLGKVRYVFFYLGCGLAAALAQVLLTPGSTLPMVGASGAVAGVLGAYLVLFPQARVRCLWVLIIFITFVRVPAWLLLGLWLVSQLLLPSNSGIAWMAHVGGFAAGAALAILWIRPRLRWT
jgi:membrane associated rhomboid family serine protease